MARIVVRTLVSAPPERCFDIARSVDFHRWSFADTGERTLADGGAVTRGLLGLGDRVTWEARRLGRRHRLTSRITVFDRPRVFVDEMERGAFARLRHEHRFEAAAGGTLVTDEFEFAAPWGVLGRVAERVLLTRYMRRVLEAHAAKLREACEGEGWREFVPAGM